MSEIEPKWKMQCKFPDFEKIKQACKTKIMLKFHRYSNSWIGCSDWKFWKKRLNGEVQEIWKAKDNEKFKEEVIDAISILSMMYENANEWKSC